MARELVESFDELLKGNRQELEALYNRPSDSFKGSASAGAGLLDQMIKLFSAGEERGVAEADGAELRLVRDFDLVRGIDTVVRSITPTV